MKNLLFVLCLLFLISCKSTQNKYSKIKKFTPLDKEEISKRMNGYSIAIPENWYSYIESHGLFWQSPKKLKQNGIIYYANHFSVEIEKIEEGKNLDNIYNEKEERLNKVYKDFSRTKNLYNNKIYGDYFVIKYRVNWNMINYTVSEVIYLYKGKSYTLKYSSWDKYYSKYLPDVIKMIESFKIIEK